jgi:2-polyprenyl-6-methoxyphenol hydroxylase-like FAD-dependent oxidoreductase
VDKPSSVAVLICGAGAAGLTLAIDLARRNISFRIIERREGSFLGSRGKGIQPRTQEIFEDLGIIDRLVAAGGLYPEQRVYHDDGSFVALKQDTSFDATSTEPYHIPLMIPQFRTEQLMRERLAELGHHVEFECELVGFQQNDEGITVQLVGPNSQETVHAHYLIGADGGRSFVRKTLGINFPGKTLGMHAIVADVALTGLDRNAWHLFNKGDMDRMVSVCPLAGTDLFQVQTPISIEGEVDLSVTGLNKIVSERIGGVTITIESISWVSAYTMNARLADQYRVGRVFIVGDAAHLHPPTGGQGLNTSVQDAYNLGWKLAAVVGGAPEDLLNSYEEERRPVAEEMLGLTTRLLDALKQGAMQRGRNTQQLDIGYPESSLAYTSHTRTSGLCAGCRAPDAILHGAAGLPRRLFDLYTGPHWTLLGFETERDTIMARPMLKIHTVGPEQELLDDTGNFRSAYGLNPGDWALIRPDGYIGALISFNDLSALDGYFTKVGLSNSSACPGTVVNVRQAPVLGRMIPSRTKGL